MKKLIPVCVILLMANLLIAQNQYKGSFTGNGGGLTNLQASKLVGEASGTFAGSAPGLSVGNSTNLARGESVMGYWRDTVTTNRSWDTNHYYFSQGGVNPTNDTSYIGHTFTFIAASNGWYYGNNGVGYDTSPHDLAEPGAAYFFAGRGNIYGMIDRYDYNPGDAGDVGAGAYLSTLTNAAWASADSLTMVGNFGTNITIITNSIFVVTNAEVTAAPATNTWTTRSNGVWLVHPGTADRYFGIESAALYAAVNAAVANDTVLLGEGDYYITNTHNAITGLRPSVPIKIAGTVPLSFDGVRPHGAVIVGGIQGGYILMNSGANSTIENIGIYCTNSYGLYSWNYNNTFKNLIVVSSAHAILDDGWNTVWKNCQIYGWGTSTYGLVIKQATNIFAGGLIISNCSPALWVKAGDNGGNAGYSVEGVTIDGAIIKGAGTKINLMALSTNYPSVSHITFRNIVALDEDPNHNGAIVVTCQSNTIANIRIENCHFADQHVLDMQSGIDPLRAYITNFVMSDVVLENLLATNAFDHLVLPANSEINYFNITANQSLVTGSNKTTYVRYP